MTGVCMNNNKDEKEPINIDIENLEDMSEEDIIKLINDITSNDINKNKKVSFFDKVKKTLLLYIKYLLIDFILVFTINSFIQVIDANFINFCIYFFIFNILNFIFDRYLTIKVPFLLIISFGLVNFVVSFLSFIISGIICIQIIEIAFSNFITCFVAIIIFFIIKKFILNYFSKLRKRGSKNVSSK